MLLKALTFEGFKKDKMLFIIEKKWIIFKTQSLPLTGQSGSEGRRQLQLTSCRSLERSVRILRRPPADDKAQHQWIQTSKPCCCLHIQSQSSAKAGQSLIHKIKASAPSPPDCFVNQGAEWCRKHQQFWRIFQQRSVLMRYSRRLLFKAAMKRLQTRGWNEQNQPKTHFFHLYSWLLPVQNPPEQHKPGGGNHEVL